MGICYQDAKMIWEARLRGVSFTCTLSIAHQSLYLHPAEVKLLQQAYHISFPQSKVKPLENYKFADYADGFFRDFLGVNSLAIMDYSPYEGADTIHDLNQPIPESLRRRFNAVIEAGSLEHIFNFPIAIANLMRMLKVGGSIFITTPCNNFCGHGFYQFSPELMFRLFTPENGFELRKITLLEAVFPSPELTINRKVYEVTDPAIARTRVGFISNKPVTMMVEARKTDDVPLFACTPLQSDYVPLWNQKETKTLHRAMRTVLKQIFEKLPFFLKTRIKGYREMLLFSFSNRRFYRRL